MSNANLWAPALLALSLPAAAAPFCYSEAEGFQFSNRAAAWKLVLQDEHSCAMTLVYGRNHVKVHYHQDKGFKLGYAIGSQTGTLDLPYLAQGDNTASAQSLDALAKAFAERVRADLPREWSGFDTQMGGFINNLELEGQLFLGQDEAKGDQYRSFAIAQYWRYTRSRCLLGTLPELKRMMDTCLHARAQGAPGFPAMNWAGVVVKPTVVLSQDPAAVRLEAADAKRVDPPAPAAGLDSKTGAPAEPGRMESTQVAPASATAGKPATAPDKPKRKFTGVNLTPNQVNAH